MSLTPGARLGPYEILSALGEGGMGEVYRARDTKLDREVAIKILPAAFAADADRLARFQREAKLLASLNHPNIGGIHGLEDTAGVIALVMELVPGEDLSQRIGRGAIPLDEAIPIARQIADALEAAHEQGIIHRDLKPANIKVRPDGTVKVLDFGLAKALEPVGASAADVTASPTVTSPAMTRLGMILGTAAYMSPEQAKGRPVDKRSDVWAFGAVLYEMLTGQRPFKGDDIADTIAAVLRQDVDWTALPASTPASVRRLLARCLDRDAKHRLRDIGEARIVLADPDASATATDTHSVVVAQPRPMWRRTLPVAVTAIVAAVLASAGAWFISREPTPPQTVIRFPVILPEDQRFSAGSRQRHLLALSPDGTQMVYEANSRLYMRRMDSQDARPIQGSEGSQLVADPVFSPDGRWVAFFAFADQTLKKVAVTGGAAVTICRADNLFGISWLEQDTIVFGQGSKGIMKVSANGGTSEVIVAARDGEVLDGPQLLPGGHVLFTRATGTARDRWDQAQVVVQSLASGERKTLITGGSDARYLPSGHLVYALSGVLYAVAFDAQRLEQKGTGVPIVEGIRRPFGGVTGAAHFSVSQTGTLIYLPGPAVASSTPVQIGLIDRQGKVEPLKLGPGPYSTPRVSPNGARVAFGANDGQEDINIYDLSGASNMQRVTFGGNNRFPIWSRDGTRLAFQSDRGGVLAIWQSTVGGAAEQLTKPQSGESHAPESWSPTDPDTFLFSITKVAEVSLWTFSVRDRKATPFGGVRSMNPTDATFSPDGRWVAYTSTDRDRTTVYVQPFPATGEIYPLVSRGADGPHEVVWSPDGKELFYNPRAGGFEVVSVTTSPTFSFGNPVAVPRPFQLSPPSVRRGYDITPLGKFVGLIPVGETDSATIAARQINVVVNWFEELKRLVPLP